MKELRKVDFKENAIVHYDLGVMKGSGKIKGISCAGVPLGGKSYIIEDLSGNVPNTQYPYRHFVCFEIHLDEI